MAAILVFYTDFQVAPHLESYLLASTMTTESGTFQSKSAAFSGVPDVLRYQQVTNASVSSCSLSVHRIQSSPVTSNSLNRSNSFASV